VRKERRSNEGGGKLWKNTNKGKEKEEADTKPGKSHLSTHGLVVGETDSVRGKGDRRGGKTRGGD